MPLTPAEDTELAARRARIMEAMDGGVMLLAAAPERVRSADVLYPYRQDSDFAYVTGFPESELGCFQKLLPGGAVTAMNEWRCVVAPRPSSPD